MKRIGSLVPPFEPCAMCDSGWVIVRPITLRGQRQGAAAVRCQCWHVHQRKVIESLEAASKKPRKQAHSPTSATQEIDR